MIDVDKFITNLKINLIRSFPFYGNVLSQLPVVYDNKHIPTFGVGKSNASEIMVKLFVNPDYVEHVIDQCNRDTGKVVNHFTEVLKHEINHLIFQHLTLDLPDRQRQMTACELSANSYVDRAKLVPEDGVEKAGVFAEDYNLASKLGVHEYYGLLNESKEYQRMMSRSMNGKSDEQKALDKLADDQNAAANDTRSNGGDQKRQDGISDRTDEAMDNMDGGGSGHDKAKQKLQEARDLQDGASEDMRNGDSNEASKKQKKASKKIREASEALGEDNQCQGGAPTLDSHDAWSSISGDELTNGMIKDIIRQANEICKQTNRWGDMPGEIMDAINGAYAVDKEIVPWEVVLKEFIASSSENVLDYTMKRKSKRYGTRPGTMKEDTLNIAIGIDTSGSIDNDMLRMFFNELKWIDKTGTKMTVFEWDTQVNREYDFHDFDGNITGRGGTDPTDFLEKISERKFDCVITFTDLYFAHVDKKYNIPMMWVCDRGGWAYGDDDYPVDDGIIMKVNSDRDGFELVRR